MALEPIVSTVYLDVYDHDTTPTVIKTVASDSRTRFAEAYLQQHGEVYNPDPEAAAYLVALRPDKTVVVGPAELITLVPASYEPDVNVPGDQAVPLIEIPAIYGPKAEITKEMLAIPGTITFQFKIVQGEAELRTEVFKAINAINVENAGSCVIDLTEGS